MSFPPRAGESGRGRLRVQRVSRRGGDRDVHTRERAEERERASHVVAVAHVGQIQSGERAVGLAQGEQVGERLAGVVKGCEHVHHRHVAVAGELREHLVRARAHPDRGDVPGEHEGGVPQRLPPRELQLVGAQHQRPAAELVHAHLEGHPRARGGLLEDQRHAAARQRLRGQRRGLQLERPVEQPVELLGAQLGAREEVSCHGAVSVVSSLVRDTRMVPVRGAVFAIARPWGSTVLAAAALAALAFASGCGSSGSSSTAATSSTASNNTASTATGHTATQAGLQPDTTPKFASPSPSAPVQSGVVPIAYRNIAIAPDTVRVKAGSTIKWTNYDSVQCNVTSEGGPLKFASHNFGEGGSFELKVTKPGTIHYECTLFPATMNGTIEAVG